MHQQFDAMIVIDARADAEEMNARSLGRDAIGLAITDINRVRRRDSSPLEA
jgi:hypothetical protein